MKPCIDWDGYRDKDGYGVYRTAARRDQRAHRVAWEEAYGPIPDGVLVCHHCDRPPCIEPTHLFLGSPLTNMQDKVAKGRHRYEPHPENLNAGRLRWGPDGRRVSSEQVEVMRELKTTMTLTAIAKKFGISQQRASQLVNGTK